MKILNICVDDYANFQHDNAKALRSVGVDCKDIKLSRHVFEYESQSTIVNESILKSEIAKADLIQIFHSDSTLLNHCKGKKVVVHHTGTRYRQASQRFNNIFNPVVLRSFIALGEFSGRGAKRETYLVGAIDTDKIRPVISKKPLSIGHYPSNATVKGTAVINKMISSLRGSFKYLHSLDLVSYQAQLERMQVCDIYIELFAPKQGNEKYGSWGITALEAAAMGKVVFTNHSSRDVYKNVYGCYPKMECWDNLEAFKGRLQLLINHPEMIPEIQKETREWVVNKHSYIATGNRLKQLLYEL